VRVRTVGMLVVCSCVLMAAAAAAPSKEKEAPAHTVDSGSFGVFVNGRRVATETFSIQQSGNGSVATSQFKTDVGADQQSSELQLSAAGDIRKYEWKELSPGKAEAVVLPNDQFLMERSTSNPQGKQDEQPFLLPASTSILDDYFFIHREILTWRYLATGCRQDKGQVQCPVNQKTQFGTLNPHARASMPVTMEFNGREKVGVHGVERDLNRFTLKSDGGDWALWLDDQFKVIRILIPGDNTEVVRD
jgi:hypothetical protein